MSEALRVLDVPVSYSTQPTTSHGEMKNPKNPSNPLNPLDNFNPSGLILAKRG
jgi:hypothetical protein